MLSISLNQLYLFYARVRLKHLNNYSVHREMLIKLVVAACRSECRQHFRLPQAFDSMLNLVSYDRSSRFTALTEKLEREEGTFRTD